MLLEWRALCFFVIEEGVVTTGFFIKEIVEMLGEVEDGLVCLFRPPLMPELCFRLHSAHISQFIKLPPFLPHCGSCRLVDFLPALRPCVVAFLFKAQPGFLVVFQPEPCLPCYDARVGESGHVVYLPCGMSWPELQDSLLAFVVRHGFGVVYLATVLPHDPVKGRCTYPCCIRDGCPRMVVDMVEDILPLLRRDVPEVFHVERHGVEPPALCCIKKWLSEILGLCCHFAPRCKPCGPHGRQGKKQEFQKCFHFAKWM